MSRNSSGYTRLRQEGDDELVSPVADEDVKPLDPPASQQAAATREEATETAPPVQSGHQPAVSTAVPPPECQPVATAMNTTTTQPAVLGMAVLDPEAKPENYLVLSIFSMLCCCFIFGLIGLIHSMKVDSSWSTGDYEGAQRAARSAKRWDIVAIGTGVVLAVIGGFMMVLSIIQYARDISYLNRVNSLNNMYHDDVNVSYMYYG